MSPAPLPSIDDILNGAVAPGPAAPAPNTTGGMFSSAIKSGFYGGLGTAASAVAAGAGAVGLQSAADSIQAHALATQQIGQQAGRADIEGRGWTEGGVGGAIQKGAYSIAKMVPSFAGMAAGAAGIAAAAPELGAGGAGLLAARGLGMLPAILGGGGEAAGAALLPQVLGAAAVAVPQAIGGNYSKAAEQPGGASQGDAIRAIAQGVPSGLIQSVAPAGIGGQLTSLATKAVGGLGSRIISSGLANAAAGAVGSGVQAASESSFDPTMTASDRASSILSAAAEGAATGGLVGGLIGGVLPHNATPEQISAHIDQALGTPPEAPAGGAPSPDAPIAPSAAPAAPAAPAAAAPEPAPAAPATPTFTAPIKEFLDANKINVNSKGALRGVVDDATDLPDLYNKIDQLPDDHQAGQSILIGRLQQSLGLTDASGQPRDLDTELAAARANGDGGAAAKLFNLMGLRDAALARREGEAPTADEPTSQTATALDTSTPATAAQPAPADDGGTTLTRDREEAPQLAPPTLDPTDITNDPTAGRNATVEGSDPYDMKAMGATDQQIADHDQHLATVSAMVPSVPDVLADPTFNADKAQHLADVAKANDSVNWKNLYGEDAAKAQKADRWMQSSNDATVVKGQQLDAQLREKHGKTDADYAAVQGRGYPDELLPDFWSGIHDKLQDIETSKDPNEVVGTLRTAMRDLPSDTNFDNANSQEKAAIITAQAAMTKLSKSGMSIDTMMAAAYKHGQSRDGSDAAELFKSHYQKLLDLTNPGATTDAIPQPSPAPQALGDRPGRGQEDGGGNTGAAQATRAEPDVGQGQEVPQVSAPVKSISDRVSDVARQIAGDRGGTVTLKALREHPDLANVSKKDLDAALLQVHNDDTNTQLVSEPKGDRADAFKIKDTPGLQHALQVEPNDKIPTDQKSLPTDATPAIDDKPADLSGPYPGAAKARDVLRISDPHPRIPPEALKAGEDRLKQLWSMAQDGKFNSDYRSLWRDVEANSHSGNHDNAVTPDGFSLPKDETPFEAMQRQKLEAAQARGAADAPLHDEAPAKTGPVMKSKALKSVSPTGVPKIGKVMESLVHSGETDRKMRAARSNDPKDTSMRSKADAILQMRQASKNAAAAVAAKPTDGVRAPTATDAAKRAADEPVQTQAGLQTPTDTVGGTQADIPAAMSSPVVKAIAPPAEVKPIQAQLWMRLNPEDAEKLGPVAKQKAFDEVVSQMHSSYRDAPTLIHKLMDLPEALRSQAKRAGMDLNGINGLYWKGKVFVIAKNIATRDGLEAIMSHEALGHFATAQRFLDANTGVRDDAAYIAGMSSVYDKFIGSYDAVEKLARSYGVWSSLEKGAGEGLNNGAGGVKRYYNMVNDAHNMTPGEKAFIVDELIAHAAASRKILPMDNFARAFAGKIKAGLATVFKKAGLDMMAAKARAWTVGDLAKYIEDSRNMLKNGPPEKASIDLGAAAPDLGQAVGMPEQRDTVAMGLYEQTSQRGAIQEYAGGILKGVHDFATGGAKWKTLANGTKELYSNIMSKSDMANFWDHNYGGRMADDIRQDQLKQAISARLNETMNKPNQDFADLGKSHPAAFKDINEMARNATVHGLDPSKRWDELPSSVRPMKDVVDPATGVRTQVVDDARASALKETHDRMRGLWNRLGQTFDGTTAGQGQRVYRGIKDAGEIGHLATMTQNLHEIAQLGHFQDLELSPYSPAEQYTQRSELHGNVDNSLAYYRKEANDRVTKMESAITAATGKTDASGKPLLDTDHYQELQKVVADTRDSLSNLKESTYFPLGRRGDYGVGFKLKMDGGAPDQFHLGKLQEAMKGDFGNVALDQLSKNGDVFSRFKTLEEANQFEKLVLANKDHFDTEQPTFSGSVQGSHLDASLSHVPFVKERLADLAAKWDTIIEGLPADKKAGAELQKLQALGAARGAFLDAKPDNSIKSILAPRAGTQGYSENMLPGLAHAAQLRAQAVGSMAVRSAKEANLAGMMQVVRDATRGKDISAATDRQREMEAYRSRDAAAATRLDNTFVDFARGKIHTFFVGFSPGYMLMQVSQLGTLTIPEFAKHHGFAASVKETGRATAMAGKIISQIVRQGHLLEGGITPKILDAVPGMTADLREHIMANVNRGDIELGSYAHLGSDLGADTGKIAGVTSKMLQYGNSTGVLSEMMARLTATIAAKRLYDASPDKVTAHSNAKDYSSHVLGQSMFNWGSYDTPKLFTAGGPFGSYGPLMFQFHQFTTKMIGKIMIESYNGFSKNDRTIADKQASRRFMYAHAAAVIGLAGSLGLPGAGWMAAAATKLSGLFNGGEDFDFAAHYRTFLAGMFGKDVGEIIARGLPRYLGTDMSDLGDNSFLPLGKLLEDRRKLEEAWPSYMGQMLGPTPSTVLNGMLGARDVMNGRPMEGMARALPVALRNVVRAYQLNEHGYVDGQGRKMPISANAADVIKQALGFESGKLVEEKEKDEALQGRNEDKQYRSGVIKQNLALAIERGDVAGQAKWRAAVSAYDRDPQNRGTPIAPTIGTYLASRAHAVAYSRATNRPLGSEPKDLPAMQLTNY